MDMITTGTARVKIVALEPDRREKKVKKPAHNDPVDYHKGDFTFQIGAFSDKKNAYRLKDKLNQTCRLVRTLIDEEKVPGSHSVHWNGRSDKGETVSSGVYLYRIEAGAFTSTKKMVISQ